MANNNEADNSVTESVPREVTPTRNACSSVSVTKHTTGTSR